MLPRTCLLVALACLMIAAPVLASPRDTKVGDVRATYGKEGTALREKASALGAPVATLEYGTQVRVLETKLPWIRVQTVARRDQPSQTGWLYAYETVEAKALSASPKPAHRTYKGDAARTAGVSSSEVSAAGRQLDAGTEKRFRASRKDLERAYAAVDRIEARTQAMDPGESIRFIYDGGLGRKGRDYLRPGRVAATRTSNNKRKARAGGLAGKLGGAALRHFGADDKLARLAEAGGAFFESYVSDIKVKFSPQQEYFIGRAVAAEAIAKYGLCKDKALQRYVRLVGDTIVRLSDTRVPANFGGYHFAVLESSKVNGISGPGGFVLITRGVVENAKSEAELAGVLAHELAHVTRKHGESLLRKGGKFPSMMKGLSSAAGAAVGGQAGQWAGGLLKFFGEVVGEMKSTAINHGYGKALEFAADKEGTWLLFDVYYDHTAVQSFLLHMRDEKDSHADAATHASPAARARALDPVIAPYKPFAPGEKIATERATRFAKAAGREPALPSFGAPK